MKSKVVFGDERVKREFEKLKRSNIDKELYYQIVKAFENISENSSCGIQLPKHLIPKEYTQRFGPLKNIWKYNLPGAWRLIYTIKNNQIELFSIVLEWLDHKEYERRFKY